jgi:chaperonin cofactor prefoldin
MPSSSQQQPIKITTEELDEIKKIQEGYQTTIFSLGKLYLHRLNMETAFRELATTEETLQKKIDDLQKSEETWMSNITKKYGEGQLDLVKGEIVPSPALPPTS